MDDLPADAGGKVDLGALLQHLAQRGIDGLHVEAGQRLNGSLLRAGWVDELLVYLAPSLPGPGRELATLEPLNDLGDAMRFAFIGVDRIGDDLRLRLRPPGRDVF